MYQVKLPIFEGPFDLLLHLIKKNEIDIYNIPISKITDEYLAYIQMMEMLDLNIAGDFIVMAATLMYIKSKMLLPPDETEEEVVEDPRAELVRKLLEYKRFKEAAEQLSNLESKKRNIFSREENKDLKEEEEYVEATLFDLLRVFKNILIYLPKEEIQEIAREEFSVAQKINDILDRLEKEPQIKFNSLFELISKRREIIAIFLALLELVRLKLIRAYQSRLFDEINIVATKNIIDKNFEVNNRQTIQNVETS